MLFFLSAIYIAIALLGGFGALAYGHPDRHIPDVRFREPNDGANKSPAVGTPFNPTFRDHPLPIPPGDINHPGNFYSGDSANPGFIVRFTASDRRTDGTREDVTSCKFATVNIDFSANPPETDLKDWSGWTTIDSSLIPSTTCAVNTTQTTSIRITNTHCPKEGTNTCGVRVAACNSIGCEQEERFFTIDKTPPYVIEISSSRSATTTQRDATFTFWASDPYGISGFKCKLDSGTFGACTSNTTQSYSNLGDGPHTFTVKAFDMAGNSSEKSLTWGIDASPPATISGSLIVRQSGTAVTAGEFVDNPFSITLNWDAPSDITWPGGDLNVTQYDIRYARYDSNFYGYEQGQSFLLNTLANWDPNTAIVVKEPFPPKTPGSQEAFTVGPPDNPLLPATSYLFGIRSRDKWWNWSDITVLPIVKTPRDLCDYDADRFYSPNQACDDTDPNKSHGPCKPNAEVCDLYDNPYDWNLPNATEETQAHSFATAGSWPADKPPNDFWLKKFSETLNDLDGDGEPVTEERTALLQTSYPKGGPHPARRSKNDFAGVVHGKDWFDNPFTSDLYSPPTALNTLPTLEKLARTTNDLDLDTYVTQSWHRIFGSDAEKPEPDEADLRIVRNNAEGGCMYKEALEATCLNCTAYDPDPATGRIPPGKTIAATNKNRAVCQIEAFYASIGGRNPPYEVIQAGTLKDNPPIPGEKIITGSAQCGDSIDNNFNETFDYRRDSSDLTREPTCPTTFQRGSSSADIAPLAKLRAPATAAIFDVEGVLKCGRRADDFKTPINESAPCQLKHLFFLFQDLMELVLFKLMPLTVALLLVLGGFLMVISHGRTELFQQAKSRIKWAFLVYFGVLFSWVVLSTLLAQIEAQKWTGVIPVRGVITAVGTTDGDTYIEDSSRTWEVNEWQKFLVEIERKDGSAPQAIQIKSNTNNRLILPGNVTGITAGTARYHILGTGWWSFVPEVTPTPSANFSASPANGFAQGQTTVDFTDLSEGEIISWQWNFGDGGTSNNQSPSHIFSAPFANGRNVTLTVTTDRGVTNTITKMYHFAPLAQFTAAPLRGRAPHIIQFANNSTGGNITNYLWDFGDSGSDYLNTSPEQNPSHTYNTPGVYTVKLTVSGPGGTHTETKLNYVFIYPAPPKPTASFHGSPIKQTTSAKFQNLSLDKPQDIKILPQNSMDFVTHWLWGLDEDAPNPADQMSTVEHPEYFYATRRNPHTVSLIAKGPGVESLPETKVQHIAFPAQAHFAASAARPQTGPFSIITSGSLPSGSDVATLSFAESATGTVNMWDWDFNGGGTDPPSTDANFETLRRDQVRTFGYNANNRYNPTLIAHSTTTPQQDTLTYDRYIAIAPYADFVFTSSALTDNSTAPPSAGPDPATQNCQTGDCTVGSSGVTVTFTQTGTRCTGACNSYWQFGDEGTAQASGISASSQITRVYANNDDYTVRLTVTGNGGSDNEEKVNYIHIAPWAEFYGAPGTGGSGGGSPGSTILFAGVDSGNVTFTNQSQGNIQTYAWNFGDGSQDTIQGPANTYDSTDIGVKSCFPVSLTVTGPGGTDVETKNNYVRFRPTASITVDRTTDSCDVIKTIPCSGPPSYNISSCTKSFTFTDASDGHRAKHTHAWTSGGTGETETKPVTAIVPNARTFTQSLAVANDCGNSNASNQITVTVSFNITINQETCPPAAAVSQFLPLDTVFPDHLRKIGNWLKK